MMAVSVMGAVIMVQNGENYGDQEALAGVAIHAVYDRFFGDEEMLELDEGPEDSPPLNVTTNLNGAPVTTDLNGGKVTMLDGLQVSDLNGSADSVSGNSISGNSVSDNSASANAVVSDGDGDEMREGKTLGDYADLSGKNLPPRVEAVDYMTPAFRVVDDSYFDDAVFIGDSRSQGFCLFSQLPNVTCYSIKSLTLTKVATKAFIKEEGVEGKMTIPEALTLHAGEFKKVYLMFGLNEIGWGRNGEFENYYYNLIDFVKQTQPDAVIYVQSIIHVTNATAIARPALSNSNIDARNANLMQVAATEHVYYINLNEIFTDETGALMPGAASDGIHLNGNYILLWKEYLKSHAIVR